MGNAVKKKLRFEIFKRDQFACQYCGRTPPSVLLHIDHVEPRSLGGSNAIDNLVTACSDCNLGKGAIPLTAVPTSLAEKAMRAAEMNEQMRAYNAVLKEVNEELRANADALLQAFATQFSLWDWSGTQYNRSVRTFLARLPFAEVWEAAELACDRMSYADSAFKYFCGICWKKILSNEGGAGA